MSILYVVRCNYADPTSEMTWNAWYSGPKQDWLLSRPGFRAGQRFEAVSASDGIRFAALYVIDSPDTLATPEYQSGWGWGKWRPNIMDWSRDLFDGGIAAMYLTDHGSDRLRLIFVRPHGDAMLARATFTGAAWLDSRRELDGSLRAIGIERIAEDQAALSPGAGIDVGVFAPLTRPRAALR